MIIFAIGQYLRRLRELVFDTSPGLVIMFILILISSGTIAYSLLEGWNILDALYATVITITTVGYGDFSPQTTGGRMFAVGFTLVAIAIAGYAFSELAASVIESRHTRIERNLRRERMDAISKLKDHMIICGVTDIGKYIAKEYQRTGVPFVLVEKDEAALKSALLLLHEEYFQRQIMANLWDFNEYEGSEEDMSIAELAAESGTLYLLEDPLQDESLIRARIDTARALLTVMPDDRDNMFVVVGGRALAARSNNQSLRIMARSSSPTHTRKLYLAGADHVRVPSVLGGYQIAGVISSPETALLLDTMMIIDDSEPRIRYRDIHTGDHPELVGLTLAQLKERYNQTVLGIKRGDDFEYLPQYDAVIEAGDIVLSIGPVFPPE